MQSPLGSENHLFLIEKAMKRMTNEGYQCFKEARINGKFRIDVLAVKGNEKIGIECLLNVNDTIIERKIRYYLPKLTKIIFYIPEERNKKLKAVLPKNNQIEVWLEKMDIGTTIQLTKKFVAWLDSQGKRNETYEEIIKRLIK